MKFDWETATASEVTVLYEAIRDLLKPKGLTWKQVFAEASPNIETGTNYEKNFSRGKIAPQRAKQIAEWLERRFPETAAYVDDLLTSVHFAIDSNSPWERFIEDHGHFSNVALQVIQLEERSYPVRRGRSGMSKIEREAAKRIGAQYEVKLHTRFTFKIDSPLEGILSVLQWSRGVWWPIPLSDFGCWAPVESGTQWCPYDPEQDDGDLPHLLSEHSETGLHRLVFIFARELHPLLKDADPEKRLDGNHLNEIAEAFGSAPKDTWQMFRLNVLFKALDAP
ncbi:hypothetical protein IVB34_33205 [Bradyrhizobium sp. 2]|uniref:hypothetical protein n=1 Tax=Bradyrhizobium sp. 2 TaxID=190045 RepID=UPI001FF9AB2E|nr:hypothetical protein [Bradyrhizobium sp. 2]MCK1463088.1 hypothetical protein [Bradyrhizobium sp. 2]